MSAGIESEVGLLLIAVAALASPLVAELIPGRLIPPVVLEVTAGIVLGPQVSGVLHLNGLIDALSEMGLGFLLFLAGMDLAPRSLRSGPAQAGILAFVAATAVSYPFALLLNAAGAGGDVRLLAIALTSTSLGVVVPVLRDARQTDTPFGQTVLVAASIGEFTSLLLLTVLFSADPKSTPVQVVYVVGLAVCGLVATVVIRKWWGATWFRASLGRLDETSSQLRVRAAFVLLLIFVTMVSAFGLTSLLGTFVAGVVLRVANEDLPEEMQKRYFGKLNAIGFGFLVPVFFVVTGAQLDIRAVLGHAGTLLLVPLFLLGMVVARGATSALVFWRVLGARGALSAGAFQTTSLTFPIVVAAFGLDLHFLSEATSAALVTAGLLSVVVMPSVALLLRPRPSASSAPSPSSPGDAAGARLLLAAGANGAGATDLGIGRDWRDDE